MKKKLLEALKQGYKNLGLSEEAFERVATFGETFVTSDEQIETFVKASASMLKAEQSAADKVRTELNAKIKGLEGEKAELEAKLKKTTPNEPEPKPTEPKTTEPSSDEKTQIAAIIAKAVADAVKPLQDEFTTFKATQQQKSAVTALDEFKASWDYAKGYPNESEDAYERVMELYEVGGKTWNAEELTNKFKEKFNKAVAKKGIDTTKPFKADDGGEKPDFAKEAELLKSEGVGV